MSINILILAAGPAEFEVQDGGYPLCLTEVDGVPLLERIVKSTQDIPDASYVFALLEEDVERFHLDQVCRLIARNPTIRRIPVSTKGSACTALLAASDLNPDAELLIISANELVGINFVEMLKGFRDRVLDGGTVIFRSVHPRYSYVRLSEDDLVIEASQQNPISQSATAGVFWFSRTSDFVSAAKNLIRKDASVNGSFYVAPTYNELILKQKRIGVCRISNEDYHPMKTERQVKNFVLGGEE